MEIFPGADETLDTFRDRSLQVLQKKKGYRFSVDTVLLSQFVRIRKNEKVVDLGTGCGILPLLLARTAKDCSFTGVEIQKEMAELARRNALLNRLEDRIAVLPKDFRELRGDLPPGSFNVVVSNPPYRKYSTGRLNPLPEKSLARHEIKTTLEDLLSVASHLLSSKGRCYLIYPASRLGDLLFLSRKERLEPKRVQLVHSRMEEEAKFILLESVKGSGAETKILKPLVLYGPGAQGAATDTRFSSGDL